MATTTPARKRSRRRIGWWIGGAVLLVLVIAGLLWWRASNQPVAGLPEGWQVVTAERGSIASTVGATGNVEARAEAELRFETSGTIEEILVELGDQIAAGQPLARVDQTDAELTVQQREAELNEAEASLQDLLAGAAPEEVAQAEARLSQARSQLDQTLSSVTAADVSAARADLAEAQARLARLQGGPAADELARAEEAVRRAQASLEQARKDLAVAKENARLAMEQAANSLRDAQAEYSRIYWENRELQDQLRRFGRELSQENRDQEEQALRAVQDGEATLEQRRLDYEQARQNEITTLQIREAELETAITERDELLAGTRAEDLAAAQAEVERAQARLAELTGANRASNVAAQEANVAIQASALEELLADPEPGTLAQAEASVIRAEVGLEQARRSLKQTTLSAPFAGTVARVDMRVGEPAGQDASITVADLSDFYIDVPVDELDVAQVDLGQPVRVTLDALPDQELDGTVENIAPLATRDEQGTTTYEVRVRLGETSTPVRAGMTAVVQIITTQKEDTVLLPRRAVRTEGGVSFVLVPTGGEPDPRSGEPASERREVVLGLSNNESVEIVSGLAPGDEVLVQDVVSTFNPMEGQ